MKHNRIKINWRLIGAPLAVAALLLAAFGLARAGMLVPPQMVDVEPDPGVHNAPVDSSISITYDQDMDPATVNPQSFAVHARQTGRLMEALVVTSGTITLDPLNDLHAGELVQTSATTATLSLGGEAPLTPSVWQFNTATWGGNAVFHEHQTLEVASSRDAALGDLDGDSDLDAITTGCGTSVVRVYHNDGSGTFTEVQSFEYHDHCQLDAELGDLDGDGDLDALIIDFWGNPNRVLLNDGDGTFSDNNQTFWSNGDTWAELGDLDGDGDLDVFVAADNINNYLRVWLNDGSGNFSLAHQFDSSYTHTDVALGDLDGDYDLDAFTAGNNNSYNKVWLNDGKGAFSEAQAIPSANTWGVQLGDLDGDGYLDAYLANATYEFSNLPDEVWLNDGTGHFTDSGQSLDAASNAFPAIGDLDADGDLDIYIGAAVFEVAPDEVWLNDGAGNFSLGRTIDDNFYGGGAVLGDLDNDGNLDVFSMGGDHGYQVLLNGDWTQAASVPYETFKTVSIHCPDDPNVFYTLAGAGAVVNNYFYKYDAAMNLWTGLAPYPYPWSWSTATCYEGVIYAASQQDFFIYDILTDTWTEGPQPPRYIHASAMGAWNGSLYIVGGYRLGGFPPDARISRYDIATETWFLQVGLMPTPAHSTGWVQVGPYLYLAGGEIIDGFVIESYRYDMPTNTWEQGPDLPAPTAGIVLVATSERLYAMGGGEEPGVLLDEVRYQQLSTWPADEWTNFDDPLPKGIFAPSAACTEAFTGGEIWSTGGAALDDDGNVFYPVTNLYHPAEPCVTFGVVLAPESLADESYPGDTVEYALTITNTGDIIDYFSISASGLWAVTVPAEVGPLAPGESAALPVSVTIPSEAVPGDWDTAVVTATSLSNYMEWDSSTITTTAITDWTEAAPIPHITTVAASIHCPDDPNGFYILGGMDDWSSYLNELRRYDAVSDTWEELAEFPSPIITNPSAVCYAGKIYAVYDLYFYIYDIASNVWEPGPPPPRFMRGTALGVWDGAIVALGGGFLSGYLDGRISRYDIASQTWELQIGVMPTPVNNAGWFQVGPYLYVAGGWLGPSNTATAETYRYDIATNTWEQGPDLPSPREYTSLVATGSRLYALGGAYELSEFYDEVYFQELSTWPNAEWTEYADPLPIAYGAMSTACTEAITGGEIWSTGGSYLDEDDNAIVFDTNLYHPAEPCIHYGLALTPASLSGEGEPGEAIDYLLTLTNTGNTADYFSLTASGLWAITLPETVGPLGAGESLVITASVTIPPDVDGGDADTASITAASISNPAQADSTTLTTTYPAVYDLQLDVETSELSGVPGETVTFSVQISNQGNITDTYDLDCLGEEWPMDMPITQITLAVGESADVDVIVHIPVQAMPGRWDAMTFTAVSQGDPDEAGEVELTTTVIGNLLYLPVIVR